MSGATPAAQAGSLEVAPTTVVLPASTASGVLYVNNYGNSPVTVQIRPFDWTQIDGKDRTTPSSTLMVSPPIVSIPAEGRQTVRLLLRDKPGASESNFRLLISELPDPLKQRDRSIQVLMEFSVPVFAAGSAAGVHQLLWKAAPADNAIELIAQNTGTEHAKLSGIELQASGDEKISVAGLGYVLPGSSRTWRVACAHCTPGTTVRVQGVDAAGSRIDVPVVVGR